MRTGLIRVGALVLVATVSAAAGAAGVSAAGQAETSASRAAAAPVGPGCAEVPTEGDGSFAGMADVPAAAAAASNPMLTALVSAVDAAGLTDALNGDGPFTIFAPSNAAFEKIPQNVIDSILADTDLLTSILTYHVVTGASLAPADLVAAGSVETSNGATIEVSQEGDTITINGGEATVVCAGVPVANATVYIVDTVLQPPSSDVGADGSTSVASSGPDITAVATPGDGPQGPLCPSLPAEGDGSLEGMADDAAATAAASNPELSTLVAAVQAAGLADALNGEGPFTIFAPSNEAFAAIPQADLDAVLGDAEQLGSILGYHVIAGESLTAADLAAVGSAVSSQGGELTFAVAADGTLTINGGAANVVCSNVTVSNATVHIIDQVLVPPAG